MLAALAGERVLAADETPVSVLDRAAPAALEEEADPDRGRPLAAGAPHVMIVRTPDELLTFLQAMGSRRKDAIAGALPGPFTGTLITMASRLSAPPGNAGRHPAVLPARHPPLPGGDEARPQLPRLGRSPRHYRHRRHPRRHRGKALATVTARNRLKQANGPREWTRCRDPGTARAGAVAAGGVRERATINRLQRMLLAPRSALSRRRTPLRRSLDHSYTWSARTAHPPARCRTRLSDCLRAVHQ